MFRRNQTAQSQSETEREKEQREFANPYSEDYKERKKKKGSISVCYTLKRYSCNTGVNIMKLLKYTSQLLPYYVHQPWHSMFLLHASIFFIAIFILFPPLLLATVFPSVIFSVSAYMCTHSGKGTDFPKDLEIFRFP